MAKNNGIIRRRIGGVSQQTGKGTDVSKFKRKPKKYEGISSTYEAARKDKPKRKVTTALGAGARGAGIEAGTEALQEKKTTTKKKTVDAKKDNGATIRKELSSAVGSKAAGKAAASKVFDTDRARKARTDKSIAGLYRRASEARGDRAREKVYSRARKSTTPRVEIETLAPPKNGKRGTLTPTTHTTRLSPTKARKSTTPRVEIETLAPPKNGKRGTPTPTTRITRLSPSISEAIGTPPRKKRSATEIMAEYVRQMKNKPGTKKPTSYKAGLRSKGGTVSRWKGGNLEVSQFYD